MIRSSGRRTVWLAIFVILAASGAGAAITAPATADGISATTGAFPSASSFEPALVAEAGDSSTIFVLGTATCGKRLCPELWRSMNGLAGTTESFTKVRAPTNASLRHAGTGSIQMLVFANSSDGYAVEDSSGVSVGGSSGGPIFATTNGGRSWHSFRFGPHVFVSDMVTSWSEFYAVLFQCNGSLNGGQTSHCGNFKLARSAAGSKKWTSVPIPGNPWINGSPVRLGVAGSAVWLSYQSLSNGVSYPHLLESTRGTAPFVDTPEPDLGGVVACGVAPMPGGAIWAECPTGNLVSYRRSAEAGQGFTTILTVAGTIGAAFDPVTADIAFAYLGDDSQILERTTSGGIGFVPVSRLPFNGGSGSQLLFLNQQDGFAVGSFVMNQRAGTETMELLQTLDGGTTWTRLGF
jgi:hypothetical protein